MLWQLIIIIAILSASTFPLTASADRITVFAAASLTEAFEEVARGFAEQSGHKVLLSLAGSSVLARQIAQGAPADVFVSANPEWMDVLEADGIIAADSRRDLLGNRLVLISHETLGEPVELSTETDLTALLGDGRLAMALVDAVPAGIYGKTALQNMGLWEGVSGRVVQVDNVRAALALVALGEADLGVVYASDALAAPAVGVVGAFPIGSHPPVVYPVARVSERASADEFLVYLQGTDARSAFERWGFSVLAD